MKILFLILFVISLGLTGFIEISYASITQPVDVDVLEYGIFDLNDNKTHLLKVGQKYEIKIHFKSELDNSVPFVSGVRVLDKDKHWTDPVDEFVSNGILQPNEEKQFLFEWVPEYEGKFQTLVGIDNPVTGTALGTAEQYDFAVIQQDTDDPFYDYFPTYRIMDLEKEYFLKEPIKPYILKKDLDGCNAYKAKIVQEGTHKRVWKYDYVSFCIVASPSTEIESKVNIPMDETQIVIDDYGNYTLIVEMSHYEMQKAFSVVDEKSSNTQICGIEDVLVDGICLTPEPEQDYSNIEKGFECGLGTTYQDGICIADKVEEKSEKDPSNCWGGTSCPDYYKVEKDYPIIVIGVFLTIIVIFLSIVIWRKRK